ncbi:type I restriction endonuclease subunit R [Chitinophaga varians]|uniref:Type I restriction endonuclease subunit R n=1 Tax=Chitinophaga varians TaxID=2202339 RepID=A0A847RQB5_9BACT|nr:type I restriction endonuclease [Chitinophaga varians]NLR63027.1 type I restriction endonuclease subunit R [Chitinophaga varians]
MSSDTSEKGLEIIIEKALSTDGGYRISYPTDYDRELCVDKKLLAEFINTTQPEAWSTIQKRGEEKFLKRLAEQIKQRGIIDVLRKGIKDQDLQVWLYYKNPASALNTKAVQQYESNIFSVTRQLRYSLSNGNSLDMVLFINGLPVSTLELKNPWTGQNVKHAIKQYQQDRDPKEPLFIFGRCMVHFAVDPDLVYMTTALGGQSTFFLPFNKGVDHGAGNPVNPHGLKSDYLWKEILSKRCLSHILEHYAQVIEEKDEDTGKIKRKLIFPRYHQLQVVQKLLADAKAKDIGQRYLVQHSAGSGKSNSITWLAHQLVSLHDSTNTQPVFDSIIMVTDRKMLDKQIRDNVKQFAQVAKVVEAIDKGSKQLKRALEDGKKIIITTVQKFPHVMDEIGELAAKKFAIIIDEAHSSQSGETASKMNWVLSDRAEPYGNEDTKSDPEPQDTEDIIHEQMQQRKMLKNASYFAFTATPKNKTLETFGRKGIQPDDTPGEPGKFYPFHLYSMKQAIEEEFILDVLKNYTTYQSYYKLHKAVEENPEFETHQAQKKLRAYVENHPFSIREKAKVMIDHFHTDVRKQIRGKAKAMVVTRSINNAIQYFRSFNEYLREIHSPYRAIAAFSGKRTIDGVEYDEAKLNGFASGDIPNTFKKNEYRFLIVANKFQTGFDQPLLHTMYVDKKLADVQAVQTLSRLNRAYKPDKEDTFVLDFFNSTDDIREAFEPFYTTTILSEETDANKLNDLQDALDNAQVYATDDVINFTDLYITSTDRTTLDPIIDACVAQFRSELHVDAQIGFYVKARSFYRTYAFLSKILSFSNTYWERLYWFLKFLIPKIKPAEHDDLAKGILEAIDLDSYRLSKTTTENIRLDGGEEIDPTPAIVKGKKGYNAFDELETIVREFNNRFGIDNWTDDDKVKSFLFQQLPADFEKDEDTVTAVINSDKQNAKITSDKKVEDLMQDIIFTYTDLYKKFTDDADFKRQYLEFVFDKIWKQHNGNNPTNPRL